MFQFLKNKGIKVRYYRYKLFSSELNSGIKTQLLRTQGREKYHEASRNLDNPSTSDAGKPEKSHIFPAAHNGDIYQVHFCPKREEDNQ